MARSHPLFSVNLVKRVQIAGHPEGTGTPTGSIFPTGFPPPPVLPAPGCFSPRRLLCDSLGLQEFQRLMAHFLNSCGRKVYFLLTERALLACCSTRGPPLCRAGPLDMLTLQSELGSACCLEWASTTCRVLGPGQDLRYHFLMLSPCVTGGACSYLSPHAQELGCLCCCGSHWSRTPVLRDIQ